VQDGDRIGARSIGPIARCKAALVERLVEPLPPMQMFKCYICGEVVTVPTKEEH
jgi:hypothetical protein